MEKRDAMERARVITSDSPIKPHPFPYSSLYLFAEQFVVMHMEIMSNFVLCLIAMVLLSVVVLANIPAILLITFLLAVVDADILGTIWFWNLQLNSITGIELIMAVGLVVDYMAHVMHFFLIQDATLPPKERIGKALIEIGPSILQGATTTFLGILPMAFAGSEIFRTFFRMFIGIIGYGASHGLIVLPVLLPWIASMRSHSQVADSKTAKNSFADTDAYT